MLIAYNMRAIGTEDAFCRFSWLCALSPCSVVYYIIVAKNALKAVVSVSDAAALLFYSFARFFCFSSLVLSISLLSISLLSRLLTDSLTYLLIAI